MAYGHTCVMSSPQAELVLPILAGLFPTSTGEGILLRARTKPVPCLSTFSGGTVVQEEYGRADVPAVATVQPRGQSVSRTGMEDG